MIESENNLSNEPCKAYMNLERFFLRNDQSYCAKEVRKVFDEVMSVKILMVGRKVFDEVMSVKIVTVVR